MTTIQHDAPTIVQEPEYEENDLAAELLARRRRRLPRLTLALALLAVAGAAFVGGIEAQKHLGSSSTTAGSGFGGVAFGAARAGAPSGGAAATGGATGFGSRAGRNGATGFGGGATGFGGGGGGATVGTVTLIKGDSLYVTDSSGNTVVVKTTASSRVTKTVDGTVETIHPGDAVTVVGTQNPDGSTTAQRLTVTPANG